MGISCNIIKPKEVAKLHPLVNIHDLVGALHLPADAVVSPPEVNHALAVAAAGQGKSDSQLATDRWLMNHFRKCVTSSTHISPSAGPLLHCHHLPLSSSLFSSLPHPTSLHLSHPVQAFRSWSGPVFSRFWWRRVM